MQSGQVEAANGKGSWHGAQLFEDSAAVAAQERAMEWVMVIYEAAWQAASSDCARLIQECGAAQEIGGFFHSCRKKKITHAWNHVFFKTIQQ